MDGARNMRTEFGHGRALVSGSPVLEWPPVTPQYARNQHLSVKEDWIMLVKLDYFFFRF
jgi:hypothetical protein